MAIFNNYVKLPEGIFYDMKPEAALFLFVSSGDVKNHRATMRDFRHSIFVVRPSRHLGFRGAIGSWRWVRTQGHILWTASDRVARFTQTKGTKGTPSTRSTSH